MNYLRLELKVCENCGKLWLRTGVMDGAYCSDCFLRLSKFPERRKHAGGRPRLARPSCRSSRKRAGGVR